MLPIKALLMRNPSTGGGGGGTGVGTPAALFVSNVSTAVITLPTYAVNDVVVLPVHLFDISGGITPTTPTGWTLIARQNHFGDITNCVVYARRMDGTEGSSVSLTINKSVLVMARPFAVSGVVTSGTFYEAMQQTGSSSSTVGTVSITSPATTTLGANRTIINCLTVFRGVNGTLASSVDAFTDISLDNSSSNNVDLATSYEIAATATVYSAETKTKTLSASSVQWDWVSFALIMA